MEKIFKLGILVLSAVFLFIVYNNLQNRRYEFHNEGGVIIVFDNKTGTIYSRYKDPNSKETENSIINIIEETQKTKN